VEICDNPCYNKYSAQVTKELLRGGAAYLPVRTGLAQAGAKLVVIYLLTVHCYLLFV